jgi:hypothetical protein
MVIIPKRIVEIREGPDVEGLQELSTIVMELENNDVLEVAIPKYLLIRLGARDSFVQKLNV